MREIDTFHDKVVQIYSGCSQGTAKEINSICGKKRLEFTEVTFELSPKMSRHLPGRPGESILD